MVLSRRLGFIFDAAFANERLCELVLDTDREEARDYLLEAIELYNEYGAQTKVLYLEEKFAPLLRPSPDKTGVAWSEANQHNRWREEGNEDIFCV